MSRTISKSSRSGLATVKRDFEEPPSSSPEVVLDWEPTQRPTAPLRPTQTSRVQSQPKSSTAGSAERLKAIQAALLGHSKPIPPPLQTKRASPSGVPDVAPLPKRARHLPPAWNDSLSSSSLMPSSSTSRSEPSFKYKGQDTGPAKTDDKEKKLARIFLSQEQTAILKLVESGDSLFYTGSAGKLCLLKS